MNIENPIFAHMLYSLRNAPLKTFPFPHFYAENVFPQPFYDDLQRKLAAKSDFKGIEGKFHGRTFSNTDPEMGLDFMSSGDFMREICLLFSNAFAKRYEGRKVSTYTETRLVRDGKGYSIGPHTDARWKLVSLLFYLPADNWYQQHGTSIYLPRGPVPSCPGGPHYSFVPFNRIYTAEYRPNTCFGFFKTDKSFHGVEPIEDDFRRDVLLYNVYDENIYDEYHPKQT